MTRPLLPDRWSTLAPLLDAALDRAPEDRSAFFDDVCHGDADLRARLEALVTESERSAPLVDGKALELFSPLLDGDDALRAGTVIAERYKIEREIGAGGMATVYLARDVRHDRNVALKVLNPELGALLGVERFLAEIKVTARLQHPNILPLFDSGRVQVAGASDVLYYVMPFVDGETLRARLERERQLPVDEVVRIGIAIASALAYAHATGIVHRDLKPENILLQAGQPVVADFGIALALANAGGARVTQSGLSLGTPQYMSPEQATASRTIDSRTDIYSLGAVLYELLTGEPPHTGATAQAIIARVLTEVPKSIRATRASVSVHVEATIMRALAKVPADRIATATEFAEALGGIRPVALPDAASVSVSAHAGRGMRPREVAAWMLAAGSVVVAAYSATRQPVTAQTVSGQFEIRLPDNVTLYEGPGTKLALSRDGTLLAVVGTGPGGQRTLYVRRLDDSVARKVQGSDSALSPAFSPDGRWLMFGTGASGLKKVPIGGGMAQTLSHSIRNSASWGDGGALVMDVGAAIWIGSSEGRGERMLAAPDTARRMYVYRWPEVLPGGTHALVAIGGKPNPTVESLRLGVVSLSDGIVTDLGLAGTNPHYVDPGLIVFGRAGGLVFSVPFSLRSLKLTGPPELLLENVWQGSGGATGFAVSRTGVLVFHRGTSSTRHLVIVDRSGAERVMPGDAANLSYPRLSSDGHRLAATHGVAIWIVDLATGAQTRLSPDSASFGAEWTRDGSRVVFLRDHGGYIYSRPWDQNGPEELLWQGTDPIGEIAVGPSHGYWAMRRGSFDVSGAGKSEILIAPAESLRAMRAVVSTPAGVMTPRVSPNGRLLAYASGESGRREVYVQPLPGPGPRIIASIVGGQEPMWSSDGSTLFYRSPTRMMSVTISEQPRLAVVRHDSLFLDHYDRMIGAFRTSYDVFSNGRAFLMVKPSVTVEDRVHVVTNWLRMPRPSRGAAAF